MTCISLTNMHRHMGRRLKITLVILSMVVFVPRRANAERTIDIVCQHGTCCTDRPLVGGQTTQKTTYNVQVQGHKSKPIYVMPRHLREPKTTITDESELVQWYNKEALAYYVDSGTNQGASNCQPDKCTLTVEIASALETAMDLAVVVYDSTNKKSNQNNGYEPWRLQDRCAQADTVDWELAAQVGSPLATADLEAIVPTSIDTTATELLKVVADIAVDRARREGAKKIMSAVQSALCEREISDVLDIDNDATTSKIALEKYLAQTCGLVRSLSFADLTAAGQSVLGALRHDAIDTTSRFVHRAVTQLTSGLQQPNPFAEMSAILFRALPRALDAPRTVNSALPRQLLSQILAIDWTQFVANYHTSAEKDLKLEGALLSMGDRKRGDPVKIALHAQNS